jgi:hypothetical protein
MAEQNCPRCGSVFTSPVNPPTCPHCGLDCGTVTAKLRIKSPRFVRIAFLLTWCAVIVPTFFAKLDWRYWAVASLLLALGLAWAYFLQKTRVEYQDSALALDACTTKIDPAPPPSLSWRPPEAPRQWKTLIALPTPREVYWPSDAKLDLLLLLIVWALSGETLARFALNHHPAFGHAISSSYAEWLLLLYLIIATITAIVPVRREFAARMILRDGDVAIGYWNEGAYQFWTRAGERFRRVAGITAPEDALTDSGLVPVFYLPEDPVQSIALCSVYARVRIPAGVTSADIARVSAPS